LSLIRILIFLFLFITSSLQAQDYSVKEKEWSSKIETELLKAKSSYGSKDSMLFEDIEELLAATGVSSQYTSFEKVKFYEISFNLLRDINSNLYATRKIEDREYRRAIRFLPSVFYYIKQRKLTEFLQQYPNEASRVLTYLQQEAELKQFVIQLGLENPSTFYSQIDDLNALTDFSTILGTLISYDPAAWVQQLDKNLYLAEISKKSSSQLIKKIVDIKQRLGTKSILYAFLDEIIKNSFNDSHELDFTSSKLVLTKKLLTIIYDPNAYARISATNYLAKEGKWVFEDFLDNGVGELSQFNSNEIFTLLVLNHTQLENEELLSVLKYLKKNDDELVNLNTLKSIPNSYLNLFLRKIEKAELNEAVKTIIDIDAVNYYLDKLTAVNERYPLQHLDWFAQQFNYEKDRQEKQLQKNKIVSASFHLNKSQMSLLSWARNINKVDSNILGIIKSPIGPRFIDYLAAFHPHILVNNRERLKTSPEFTTIVNKLAYYSPNTIKKYLGSADNSVSKQVFNSQESISKTLVSIFNQYKFNSKAYTLIHKIMNREITIEEAHRLGNTEVPYLKSLMSITIQKNPIGIHSVEEEQNQLSLKFIREINDNPSQSHPNLQEIRNFTAKEIYSLMVLGKEEIFQFAFDNCYRVFTSQLTETNFINFVPRINHYKYREFCTLLANFDKFPELFYKNSTPDERSKFIEQFVHIDFNDIKCIEQAAVICEFVNNCDDTEIQSLLQTRIHQEYKDAEFRKEQLSMAVYSLLGSNIGHRATVSQEWFAAMKAKYAKYTLSYIDVNELKNKQNKIIEVCYFYNDADGVASFNSYINTFKAMPKWYLQDIGSYYYISSLEGNDYDIFANKPQYEQTGQQSMRDYLLINKLEPSIIVHRGHSYHSQKTIDQLIGSPKFIFMGSCGGYYKISELLVRSPDAQILSTKQVGTMGINDPMLRTIHELIRTNQNIDWPTFWTQQESKMKGLKDFKMYIPPHRNNGALFINAFFKVVGF
jgi:hypothetical protein